MKKVIDDPDRTDPEMQESSLQRVNLVCIAETVSTRLPILSNTHAAGLYIRASWHSIITACAHHATLLIEAGANIKKCSGRDLVIRIFRPIFCKPMCMTLKMSEQFEIF